MFSEVGGCGRRWSVQGAETTSGKHSGRLSLMKQHPVVEAKTSRGIFPKINYLQSTNEEKRAFFTDWKHYREGFDAIDKYMFVHAKQSKTSSLWLSCAADCGSLPDSSLGSHSGGVCAQSPRGSHREGTDHHFYLKEASLHWLSLPVRVDY